MFEIMLKEALNKQCQFFNTSALSQKCVISENKEIHRRSQRKKTEPETVIRNVIAEGVQNRCRQGQRVKLYFYSFLFLPALTPAQTIQRISA